MQQLSQAGHDAYCVARIAPTAVIFNSPASVGGRTVPRRVTRYADVMPHFALTVALGLLLAIALPGCATSPAEQEAARQAWAARDAERERECQRALGWWKAGACVFGGGSM